VVLEPPGAARRIRKSVREGTPRVAEAAHDTERRSVLGELVHTIGERDTREGGPRPVQARGAFRIATRIGPRVDVALDWLRQEQSLALALSAGGFIGIQRRRQWSSGKLTSEFRMSEERDGIGATKGAPVRR